MYFPDHDNDGLMKNRRDYFIRGDAVEPKLQFPIEPLNIEPRQNWSFDSIVDRIVLGPTHARPLALASVKRMLEGLGRPEFGKKLWVSQIPYRPIG